MPFCLPVTGVLINHMALVLGSCRMTSQTCLPRLLHKPALFPPSRWSQVVYGADKQSWSGICGAVKKGDIKDGDVTLVLERRRSRPAMESAKDVMRDIFS